MNATLKNDKLSVTVTSLGAELTSIFNTDNGIEYLWQGDQKYWSGRAPILFPFVGASKNNAYLYNGKEYTSNRHGFARNSEFEIIDQGRDFAVFRLNHNNDTFKIYPFKFTLDVEYRLGDNGEVENIFTIKNTGEATMPFSIGGHPGFNCPLTESEGFEDYYLEFEKNETQHTYEIYDGLFKKERHKIMDNENIIRLNQHLFDNDALILENLNSKYITIKSDKSRPSVKVSVENWKYVGIWSKGGDSPFVCIEPWTGTADDVDFAGDVTKKRNIFMLSSNESYINNFTISIN